MKTQFINLEKPCQELIENMTPNEKGMFCHSCAKNVLDFSKLAPSEISNIIKSSKGDICARVTKRQLNTPLLDLSLPKQYHLPYSNMAAGLMIATLTACQPSESDNLKPDIALIDTHTIKNEITAIEKTNQVEIETPIELQTFKGHVISDKSKPIENAKISFITIDSIHASYTQKDGSFILPIPTHLIDHDNVIRVSYDEVIGTESNPTIWFETEDYVLSKVDLNSNFQIKAEPTIFVFGGLGLPIEESTIPIALINGVEIKYKDFIKSQQGKSTSCNTEQSDYYYFESKAAIALYGKRARGGLYLLID